jgi:hypothetical protein
MSSNYTGAGTPLSVQADFIFGASQSLMTHPQFFIHLDDIVNYLQLSDKGWACFLHVRRDSHDSLLLKEIHPELFKVPNDLISKVDALRSGEKWSHYSRSGVLERFSSRHNERFCSYEQILTVIEHAHAGKLLYVQIPGPEHRPPSYSSTTSSARDSLPPYSGSEKSARTSTSSAYISDWPAPDQSRIVSRSSVPWEADYVANPVTPSPAAQRARKIVELRKCPGCDKTYEKYGNLVRHLKVVHPEHPETQKYNLGGSNDLPTNHSGMDLNNTDLMPPPSSALSALKSAQKGTGLEAAEKPLPPDPPKDSSKRPFPDSPTSQFGPRAATEPATEAESEPYGTSLLTSPFVEDTWSNSFHEGICQNILGILSNHDFDNIGLDMEGFE